MSEEINLAIIMISETINFFVINNAFKKRENRENCLISTSDYLLYLLEKRNFIHIYIHIHCGYDFLLVSKMKKY